MWPDATGDSEIITLWLVWHPWKLNKMEKLSESMEVSGVFFIQAISKKWRLYGKRHIFFYYYYTYATLQKKTFYCFFAITYAYRNIKNVYWRDATSNPHFIIKITMWVKLSFLRKKVVLPRDFEVNCIFCVKKTDFFQSTVGKRMHIANHNRFAHI